MFDRQIEETIEIAASPAEVWWQLTSFRSYPDWNPFITRIEGELREGERLSVRIEAEGLPPMTVSPEIITADPERELRWLGRLALPKIFDGEHAFIMESVGIDRVRFIQRERFGGLLVPGTLAFAEGAVRKGFRQMNEALRQRAEAAHASQQVARDNDEPSA